MQRDYAVRDKGEQLLLDEEWVKVDSITLCECDTLTTNGTHCDSCIECGCDPEICRCDCHKPSQESIDIDKYVKSKEFWRNRG